MSEEKSKFTLKKKQIRHFFMHLSTEEKEKNEIQTLHEEIINVGMKYKQMTLPVANITDEFEKEIQKEVDHNILKAKIREASKSDLRSVMYLYNRAWMTSNTPFSPISIDSLERIYEYSEIVILVAKVFGEDAGFVILDFEGHDHEYGIIAGLGVLPRYQRKGLGTVLGMAAWNYFKKANVREIRCEVYVKNIVSYEFIKSLGFKEQETRTYNYGELELKEV